MKQNLKKIKTNSEKKKKKTFKKYFETKCEKKMNPNLKKIELKPNLK